MKRLILIGLLLLGIFIVGCQEGSFGEDLIVDEEEYDDVNFDDDYFPDVESSDSNDDLDEASGYEAEPGECEIGWKCISLSKMIYQNADCSFGEKKDCLTICENNTCRPAKVCDPGFKCINDEMFGYQKEDCTWIKKKSCEAGCEKGDCVEVDENATVEEDLEVEEEEEEESEPIVNYEQLNIGESVTLEEMSVSIYILEEDRVKLTVDGKNSNWLTEGEAFTRNDLTINVEEILFQKYGTKAISYTVG